MKKFILALALALLASVSVSAQQARRVFQTTSVAADLGVREIGSGVQFHQLTWNVTGSVPTCQVTLESSADNVTWGGTVIAAQTCTSNGLSAISTATIANYVRINVTTKSGAGTVTVTYLGYTSSPSGGGTVTGSGASPQVAFWSSPSALTGSATFTWADGTNSKGLFTGPASSSLSTILQGLLVLGIPELQVNRHVLSTDADTLVTGQYVLMQSDKNILTVGFVPGVDATNVTSQQVIGEFIDTHINVPVANTNGSTQSGSSSQIFAYGAGTSLTIDGFTAQVFNTGTGTITSATGFNALAGSNTGGGAITNSYGFHAGSQASVGSTLNADFISDEITTTGNNFAFYNILGKSRFHFVSLDTLSTVTNCAANGTAANPSVVTCGANAAGMFSCATAASTGTCQVNTTAVTANSEIFITQDAADGGASQLNVTCNTGNDLSATAPLLASKNTGVSFTINLGTVATNPACFEYHIVN